MNESGNMLSLTYIHRRKSSPATEAACPRRRLSSNLTRERWPTRLAASGEYASTLSVLDLSSPVRLAPLASNPERRLLLSTPLITRMPTHLWRRTSTMMMLAIVPCSYVQDWLDVSVVLRCTLTMACTPWAWL